MVPPHLKMIQILLTVLKGMPLLDVQMPAQNIQKENKNRFHSATKGGRKGPYHKSIETVAKDFKIQPILQRELRCFVLRVGVTRSLVELRGHAISGPGPTLPSFYHTLSSCAVRNSAFQTAPQSLH